MGKIQPVHRRINQAGRELKAMKNSVYEKHEAPTLIEGVYVWRSWTYINQEVPLPESVLDLAQISF
jgi:hypothetical protein